MRYCARSPIKVFLESNLFKIILENLNLCAKKAQYFDCLAISISPRKAQCCHLILRKWRYFYSLLVVVFRSMSIYFSDKNHSVKFQDLKLSITHYLPTILRHTVSTYIAHPEKFPNNTHNLTLTLEAGRRTKNGRHAGDSQN